MRRFRIRLLILAFWLLPTVALAQWHHLPAGYPDIHYLASDSSGQKLWIHTPIGYWHSADGGHGWSRFTSFIGTDTSFTVSSLQVVDAAAETLLVSLRDYLPGQQWAVNLHKLSTNGGESWRALGDTALASVRELAVHPWNHSVWLGIQTHSPGALVRTTDAGQTWEALPLPDYEIWSDFWFERDNATAVFAMVRRYDSQGNDNNYFLISSDLGGTWRPLLSAEAECGANCWMLGLASISWSTYVTLLWPHLSDMPFLLGTTNYGATWLPRYAPPPEFTPYGVQCGIANPNVLYMSGSGTPGLYRSYDYGYSWSQCGTGLPAVLAGTTFVQNPFSGHCYAWSTNYGLYKSEDAGESWSEVELPSIGSHHPHKFTIHEHSVFGSDEYGGSYGPGPWMLEPPYTVWRELHFPSTVAYDSFYSYSPLLDKRGDSLWALASVDRSLSFGMWDVTSRMVISRDNGLSWRFGPQLPCTLNIENVSAFRGQNSTRWVATGYRDSEYSESDRLYLSRDRGQSWQLLMEFPYSSSYTQILQTERAIYALLGESMSGAGHDMVRSTDEGASWQALQGLPNDDVAKAVLVGDDVFLQRNTGREGWLWHNGQWENRGPLPPCDLDPMSSFPYFVLTMPAWNQTYLAAMVYNRSTVWLSADTGRTWQPRHYEIPFELQRVDISSLTYDEPRRRLWVATSIGPCYMELDQIVRSDEPVVLRPADFTLLSCYPNPFNSSTRIRYDLEQAGRVELKLFDLQGRLVQTLVDDVQTAGRHEFGFSAEGLASGTYFVRLHSPATTRTEKILLLK